jgi:hypothetical protein
MHSHLARNRYTLRTTNTVRHGLGLQDAVERHGTAWVNDTLFAWEGEHLHIEPRLLAATVFGQHPFRARLHNQRAMNAVNQHYEVIASIRDNLLWARAARDDNTARFVTFQSFRSLGRFLAVLFAGYVLNHIGSTPGASTDSLDNEERLGYCGLNVYIVQKVYREVAGQLPLVAYARAQARGRQVPDWRLSGLWADRLSELLIPARVPANA